MLQILQLKFELQRPYLENVKHMIIWRKGGRFFMDIPQCLSLPEDAKYRR